MSGPLDAGEVKRRMDALEYGRANNLRDCDVAGILGITPTALAEFKRKTLPKVVQRDAAIQAAMDAVGTQAVPHSMWTKIPPKDGEPGYSVYHKIDGEPAQNLIERVADAFASIPPAQPVIAPETVLADYCAVYPLFDAHFGMHAWGRETGKQDYDLKLASADLIQALDDVMAVTPAASHAIFLLGGDTLHAENDNAETKRNKHKLDVDGRHYKVIDTVIEVIAHAIERLLGKHQTVAVRVMRGNHDEDSHLVLPMALAQRYRNEPRVEIIKDPRDLFMFQWGKCAIFGHHGDKQTFQRMFNLLAAVCPFWSDAPFRHYLSGHWHSEKSVEIGGMVMETLRPFCPPDAYGSMWPSVRALQSLTFHKRNGLVLRAYDPVLRAA